MIINGPKFKKATLFIEAYEIDKFDFLCLSPYDWLSQLKELVFSVKHIIQCIQEFSELFYNYRAIILLYLTKSAIYKHKTKI